jgi:eukaryotic-like serine/threonine-protein kinase
LIYNLFRINFRRKIMTLGQGNLLYNRYRVLEILGRGGMGAVYRATDESLGMEVAVKENLFTTDDYARQFRMEAVILAGLRHPNLPRVTDHFVIDDMGQYLVMDYIQGDDLRQRMEKEGPISEDEAIRIGAASCDALAYLHSRKPPILHRDIKLGNIKLSEDGNVYLVDFGLAKMAWEHEETMTGARAMTPGYSPPEQYGSARTDARSDVYSLGATLYAALTGVIPEDSLMRAVDGMTLTPLREHRPEVSPRLAAVIEKALEVTPINRYQTAEEFKRALLSLSEPDEPGEPKRSNEEESIVLETQIPVPSATPAIPMATPTTPRKASCLGRLIGAFFILLVIVGGSIWLNPLYRDLFLAQFFPAEITSATPVLVPKSTNTLAPVVFPSPSMTDGLLTPSPAPATPLSPTANLTETAAPALLVSETPLFPVKTPVSLGTPQGGGVGEIAFAAIKDNVAQIFITNPDGTTLRQLTHDLNGACNFDWSPDGKQIVYVSPCNEKALQYPNSALYVFDVEKGTSSLLFSAHVGDFEPAWSPDGTKIAFTSMRDGSMQIYVYNLSDTTLTRLTTPGNNIQSRYPAWSPDGTKIAYTVRRFSLLQLWTMDANGEHQQQLTRPGGSFSDYLPAWSPDGKSLLFSEANADLTAPSSLMRLVLGDEKAKLVPVQVPVADAVFSPDGQWIAYETWDIKNQDVFIYQLSGGIPQRLTTLGTNSFDPAWRPGN